MQTVNQYRKVFLLGAFFLGGIRSMGGAASADEAVTRWIKRLEAGDLASRARATFDVENVDWGDQKETQALILGMRHPDPFVRRGVAIALGELELDATLTVPALTRALKDPDRLVRDHSLAALVKIGPPAVPALVEALDRVSVTVDQMRIGEGGQTDVRLSDYASFALSEIGRAAVPALVRGFRDRLEHGRRAEAERPREDDLKAAEVAGSGPNLAYLKREIAFVIGHYDESVVPDLVALLDDELFEVRALALDSFDRLGPKAEAAVPALLEFAMRAGDNLLVNEAIRTLRSIGPAGMPALGKILRQHPRVEARRQAAYALQGADSKAVTALEEALRLDPDAGVRASVADALAVQGPKACAAIETAAQALQDLDAHVRDRAAYAVLMLSQGRCPKATEAVPLLVKALRRPEGRVQAEVASALGNFGAKARAAVPVLMGGLKTPPDFEIGQGEFSDPRGSFIRAIQEIGTDDPAFVDRLIELLRDPGGVNLHWTIHKVLGKLGPRAAAAVPVLIQRLRSEDYNTWWGAANALRDIRPGGPEALAGLVADRQLDHTLRIRAADTLAGVDPKTPDVVDVLVRVLEAPEADIRWAAARGLASSRQGVDHALPVLEEALREAKPSDRYKVFDAFKELGPAGVPALIKAQGVKDPALRAGALETLTKAAPNDPRTVSELIRGLHDASSEVRAKAAILLGELRPSGAEAAVHALVDLLEKETVAGANFSRSVIFEVLRAFGPRAKAAVPGLRRLLARDDPTIRRNTLEVLTAIGPDAEVAETEVITALRDPDASVRSAAVGAIEALRLAPGDAGPLFSLIAIEKYLQRITRDFFNRIADVLRPRPRPVAGGGPRWGYNGLVLMADSQHFSHLLDVREPGPFTGWLPGPTGGPELPRFPWPPPRWTHIGAFGPDIPRELLGTDDTTLGEVHQRLHDALLKIDHRFESGLFSVPGGFALLAKLERVRKDGTPLSGDYRWFKGKVTPLSLSDYIGKLFLEQPGYFRIIAFVVTPRLITGPGDEPLPPISRGVPLLTEEIAREPIGSKYCYIIIYTLKKVRGGAPELLYESPLSVLVHLEKAGIIAILRQ